MPKTACPPASTEAAPVDLTTTKSGVGGTGVSSEAVLSAGVKSVPFVPSSLIVTVLDTESRVVGAAESTVTAKLNAKGNAPAGRVPTSRVKVPPPWSAHPAELPAASKVVLAGSVSVSTTPVAP